MTMGNMLYVDDDPFFRMAVDTFVHDAAFTLYARSARDALDLLGRVPMEAVVANVDMPGINGIQLLHLTRQLQPDAYRVLVGQAQERRALLQAPLEDAPHHLLLGKPFARLGWKRMFAQILQKANSFQPAAAPPVVSLSW